MVFRSNLAGIDYFGVRRWWNGENKIVWREWYEQLLKL